MNSSVKLNHNIVVLVDRMYQIMQILRFFVSSKLGGSTSSLLKRHLAMIGETIVHSLHILRVLSQTQIPELPYMLARSLHVCLGVPRSYIRYGREAKQLCHCIPSSGIGMVIFLLPLSTTS